MKEHGSFARDRLSDPRKKTSYRRRSSSSSSSSDSSDSPRKIQDLCSELRVALDRNDSKQVNAVVKELSRSAKEEFGILRVSIANTFEFHKNDIEEFFGRFGRIENVIIKESKQRDPRDAAQQLTEDGRKPKESENVAYVIYSQHYSAVVALKVLQSISEKDRIIDARICYTDNSIMEEETVVPSLGQLDDNDFILDVQNVLNADMQEAELLKASDQYRYFGTIGIDLEEDKSFCVKDRVIGVKGCNFLRIYYVCEKAARFENEDRTDSNDLKLKLVNNRSAEKQREVAIFANNLLKYNTAVRYAHQLFEQIVEQYKNSRQKSQQIIPKDIHIRRWEKIKAEPTLKFLQPKAM